MTPLNLLVASMDRYWITLAFYVAVIMISFLVLRPIEASYLVTAIVAALLRDIASLRQSAARWSIVHDVLDWAKIESLVADDTQRTN